MPRSLTSTALASANAQQTDEVWLVLLTIQHNDLEQPIRVVNNTEQIVSRGQTYVGFPFDFELPGEDADSPSKARLRIDNVDRRIVEVVRRISSPPLVTLEVILASAPDTVEFVFSGLTMREIDYDVTSVSGDLLFESIFAEPVTYTMTPSRFPGLY
jgi:hypothetical protein